MNDRFALSAPQLPARLDMNQAAEILGFLPYEISALVSLGLLKPLGEPTRNGHKFLCTDEILELYHDRAWLNRATRNLSRHYRAKNQRTSQRESSVESLEDATG
jgi:hypothetical protein